MSDTGKITLSAWGRLAEHQHRVAKYLRDTWGINGMSRARLLLKTRGKIESHTCDWSEVERKAKMAVRYDSWEPDTVWIYSIKEKVWCYINMNLMEGRPSGVQICNDGEASVPKEFLLYNALLEE